MTTAAEKNSVRNNQVINDFGQKIGGAHKDRAREAAERLAGVDASALLLHPLSKVAKLPDLRGLYLAGVISSDVARLAWYYWAQIGTKPSGSWPTRLQRWADRAAALIGEVSRVLSYGLAEKSQISDFLAVEKPAQKWDLFNEEMTAANWPADEYKRGAYFVGHYWMNPARFSIHTEKGSYSTAFDSVAECVKAIRAKVEKNTTKEPQKFSMYQTSAGKYFISPKGKSGIKLLEFDNSADAWAAYGYTEKLGKIYEELKKFPSERRDWNRPRLGEDWRGGQDMTPEAFGEVFPFRGVEFGNWVNQLERAACLNECADALNDLAGVIGIRPEAVALGGSLAWAFGSRGVGKALAHYEPARRVVNLTKKKGNGCVAHEWFHALDNYMMIKAGKPSLMAVSDTHAYGGAEKSPIFEAAKALKNALLKSDMYTRSRRIDAFRSAPYWATVTEMAARGFEAVVFYALQDAGLCNDYLVSIKEATDYTRSECYPYPTREEAAELAPLYRDFIEAAFTEAEREVIKPAAELPAPPTLVTYDPAQPIESAPFQVQDEAPAVAASEPMDANNDPTPADGVQGAAYGDAEKSPNPEAYGEELADLVALHAMSKQKHPDALVLFRMGEWYHAYFAYAQTVADTTGVILRKHHGAAMAGFPSHALDSYLPRLIRAGHRVVLLDAPATKVQESAPANDPTPTNGGTGAAYGDSEKSQNSRKEREEKPYNIPTLAQSLRMKMDAGTITLHEAAREFCRHGWTNFVDEDKARHYMYGPHFKPFKKEGEAYGDAEKSQISINPGDVYKVVAADRIVIVLEEDEDYIKDTDVIRGRFTGVISRSDKKLFVQCVESGKMVKVDASVLPPVINGVYEWQKCVEPELIEEFNVRTRKIYEASDKMTTDEKRELTELMGFTSPVGPLDILKAAGLHRWNGSVSNFKNCAAIEWLIGQTHEEAAFWMNAGAYPVLFSDYIRRI